MELHFTLPVNSFNYFVKRRLLFFISVFQAQLYSTPNKIVLGMIPDYNTERPLFEIEAFITMLREDGILKTIVRNNFAIEEEHAVEIMERLANLDYPRPPLLVDMRQMKSITKGARQAFAASGKRKAVSAVALLSGSYTGTVVANFFIELDGPSLPTRMFTSEAKAVEWLTPYLNPNL